jgi:formamidopyrimidine-DNA glycosylase
MPLLRQGFGGQAELHMPELPEVETIKVGLQKYLVGHTITDVDVRLQKQLRGDYQTIIGGKVRGVRRFGKGLVIDLDNKHSIAVHVKMTGQLLYRKKGWRDWGTPGERLQGAKRLKPSDGGEERQDPVGDSLPDAYTHIVFQLDNGAVLYYRDMRQFGWVHVLRTEAVSELAFFKSLGAEPLKDLTFEKFRVLLAGRKTPIKLLLMDQTKIAGIGNIYANDALYLAKIHPKRPANALSQQETKKLFEAIEYVLQKGIEVGGASEWHYVDVLGGRGRYQNFFLVYRKDGKLCKNCGTVIEKMKLGGRGTFFCPICQA